MKPWTKIACATSGGIAVTLVTAAALGGALWNRSTNRALKRLHSQETGLSVPVFSSEQLEGLPEPVARYFKFALPLGQLPIRCVRIEHAGEFRTGPKADWNPFTSVQHCSANPPGFVWDASVRMAPFLAVRVRDSYIGGGGAMQVKIAGLISVVDESDRAELDAGALHRYLAEAVWFPSALLPGRGVVWTAIDDMTALATLSDGSVSVSLQFGFNEQGEITRVFTPARYRETKGNVAQYAPWEGFHSHYASIGGLMVPMKSEVGWILSAGRFSYWRGKILDIKYEFEQEQP